ncbi:protein of unknown function [Xenorhabdus doucetiae]|uniref:Uncharacterized protein n=1 Tax=Xenorhabdus doucetiae TaxID=351671 RepID=A0A068QXD9_9GAMM|nr:protein of unknown function [Xenorhabdus doucetiae]
MSEIINTLTLVIAFELSTRISTPHIKKRVRMIRCRGFCFMFF